MDELHERLARLAPFRTKQRRDFDEDPYLRDIVERNLEIAAQCCIDISHRIISLEKAQKPRDYFESIIRMADLGVLPLEFAQKIAPIAGFRNILVHEYIGVDWNEVYRFLNRMADLLQFAEYISDWMKKRTQ